MPEHVAILKAEYLDLILLGRKTVESRLTVRPLAPFRQIAPGEKIHFKQSSGPYRATAVAGKTEFYENLTVELLRKLYRKYNQQVCGTAAYWRSKTNARFASLIHLTDVRLTDHGPAMTPSSGLAWFVIDEAQIPANLDIPITGAGLRNNSLRITAIKTWLPEDVFGGRTKDQAGRPLTLNLPDGKSIRTDVAGSLIRWRGWGHYYQAAKLREGDIVRFIPLGGRAFRVTFLKASRT